MSGHLRAFTLFCPELVLSQIPLFCVNFWGPKLRLHKSFEKYDVWFFPYQFRDILFICNDALIFKVPCLNSPEEELLSPFLQRNQTLGSCPPTDLYF